MSTTVTIDLACPVCGHAQSAQVAESANVQRAPIWRDQVLARTFMRVACSACRAPIVLERELLYTDLERGLFIAVFPRGRRGEADALAAVVERAFQAAFVEQAPAAVRASAPAIDRRVVFGYDELREKVVARDAAIDDRALEALKLMLGDAAPPGGTGAAPALTLLAADHAWLELAIMTPLGVETHRVARSLLDDLAAGRAQLATVLAPLFDGPYVHASRCLPTPVIA
jgi:CpXC motif protein